MDANAEIGKNLAPQKDRSIDRALTQSDKSELGRLQAGLNTLKQTKEREIGEIERNMNDLQVQLEKRQRELYIINGKGQAIRDAIRRLEDLGIIT